MNLITKKNHIQQTLNLTDLEIIPSPVLENYRNIQEFTFGWDQAGNNAVGHYSRKGKGNHPIIPCQADKKSSYLAIRVSQKVLEWITNNLDGPNKLPIMDKDNVTGVWRHIRIKENYRGDYMLILTMLLNDDVFMCRWAEEQLNLIKFLQTQLPDNKLCSAYYQPSTGIKSCSRPTDPHYQFFYSQDLIMYIEKFRFKRSPSSFFQPNIYTARIIYDLVRDMTKYVKPDTLLDICCGTGTIGIYLSKQFRVIYGIDRTHSAIQDSIDNAKLNQVKANCNYYAGDAEHVLPILVKNKGLQDTDLVAVVNPPRRGLYPPVIRALNSCKQLKTLIYVSCNVVALDRDLKDLNLNQIEKCVAVDQFPGTTHCEVIVKLTSKR